jgi:hypothetical protein
MTTPNPDYSHPTAQVILSNCGREKLKAPLDWMSFSRMPRDPDHQQRDKAQTQGDQAASGKYLGKGKPSTAAERSDTECRNAIADLIERDQLARHRRRLTWKFCATKTNAERQEG